MPLPNFNEAGDLPAGVYRATLDELLARFGTGSAQREEVTARLTHIYELAKGTGKLLHFVVFGSYITDKPEPNDVDIVLVMSDDFELGACEKETRPLFDHQQADERFGASVFWARPGMLFHDTLDEFIAHWQIKRNLERRGIVEVVP
jgi:hypothetical protein